MKLMIQPARVRRRAVALAAAAASAVVGLAALAGPAAAATSVQIDDGTLQIKGDAAGNKLALVNQPAAFALDLGADGTPEFTIDRAAFTAVEIAAGNGDDEVTVVNGGGASDKPITIDGGAGNDTLRGSAASETLIGGSGDDVVDGNLGADVARLGSGDDHFQWDPGDASDTVEGQGGADVLDFNASNASEIVDIAADGSRVRLTRNIGSVTLDLDALEQVRLRALAGTDQITVGDLAGTGLRLADIDLGSSTGDGDNAADTVVAVGTDGPDGFAVGEAAGKVLVDGRAADVQVSGSDAQDRVRVASLGEADTITSAVGVPGPASVEVDGGDGADRAISKGTTADDTVAVQPNGGAVAVSAPGSGVVNHIAVESLAVQGFDGADTLSAGNGIGTLTELTLDGGEGGDKVLGGDGADTLLGGPGDDLVDGNRGADVAKLGVGDDRFQWDPGDANDTVEGQGGSDALDFNASNASEQIDVTRNGGRVRLTRNIGAVTMDFDDVESLLVRVLGGQDGVTVGDLAATDLLTADVDLSATGGGGDSQQDTVVVNGRELADVVDVTRSGEQVLVSGLRTLTRISGSESLNDTLRLNTLGGFDRVTIDPDAELLITPVVDLGTGQ